MTKTYKIERAYSGIEKGELWVSLCYTSEHGEDVLHIVCAVEPDEQDRRLGMNTIYLCGDDQSRSCYAGADKIEAMKTAVRVHLNKVGRKALEMDQGLELLWTPRTVGRVAALRCLAKMKQYECGKVVHVA